MKKKMDKTTLLTAAVVTVLILIFVIGFIWGLGNVLAMEGTYPPFENVKGTVDVPADSASAASLLSSSINGAAQKMPYVQSDDVFEIDEDSIKVEGRGAVEETFRYLREDFETSLSEKNEAKTADFFESSDAFLKKPVITAQDIESFECSYIYYQCPSCSEESDEPHENCELCGGTEPYTEKYRDEYTVTVQLKNSERILTEVFDKRDDAAIKELIGDDAKDILDIKKIDVTYDKLSVEYSVSRLDGKISHVSYVKEMTVKADAAFKGDFASLGECKAELSVTERNNTDFTWPKLELSESEMTVEPKKSDNLLATLTCDDATKYTVTWMSSDENIVTVDEEGYFKAGKEAGNAVITASFTYGNETYTDTCDISVKYPVESMKISDRKLNMNVGDTFTLSTKVSPSNATVQTVKWYTGDEKIASVDENGKVTAKSAGTVTVYALSDDGYYKSSCEVRVK